MASAIYQAAENPLPANESWPLFPTETEIYLLPNGQVIIADMPVELADLATALGATAQPMPTTAIQPATDKHFD